MVDNHENHMVGIDISFNIIECSVFSLRGSFLRKKQISSPDPLIPGAVTIKICESIDSLDPLKKIISIGILLPPNAEVNSSHVQKIVGIPGWDNVPLAQWLEIRLKRKVVLVNLPKLFVSDPFLKKRLNCEGNEEISFQRSFIAAYIASQY